MVDDACGQYQFRVLDREDGSLWIWFEPLESDIEPLEDVMFGIDLPPGTTRQKASEIAAFLNLNLGTVHFSRLHD
ncbi:MAG: hypothetical protein FJW37_00930 [Acidobacteria bacterium]|nr:hypothetical protein [Acidobacteriota bacterium]